MEGALSFFFILFSQFPKISKVLDNLSLCVCFPRSLYILMSSTHFASLTLIYTHRTLCSHHLFPRSSVSWGCFTGVPAMSLAWLWMSITGLWYGPCCIMHESVPLGKKWPTARNDRWRDGGMNYGWRDGGARRCCKSVSHPNWRLSLTHTSEAAGQVTMGEKGVVRLLYETAQEDFNQPFILSVRLSGVPPSQRSPKVFICYPILRCVTLVYCLLDTNSNTVCMSWFLHNFLLKIPHESNQEQGI